MDSYKGNLSYDWVALKGAFFVSFVLQAMPIATEYSTDPVLELSHAAVSTKSLFHVHVNKVVVVVFWEYDVFEFNEPSVVSFPQKVVDADSLSVEFFFRQTASEATSCLYLGAVNHLDASAAI